MNFNIETVQDFLEQLCREHALVQHEANGQRCFVRYQSQEHLGDVKNKGGKHLVLVIGFNGRRVGDKDDQRLRRDVVLRFAVYADKATDVNTARQTALNTAEEIMLDFVSRMEQEQQEDDCGIMKDLEAEKISWEEIEDQPWLLNHYGWDLVIPFKSYMPAYDAAKWS